MPWIATALGWAFSMCLFLCIFVGLFLWAARWGHGQNDPAAVSDGAPSASC
jgi:hypothetical protein